MASSRRHIIEGLRLARLLMVLSSFSPLFILWAIRGTDLLPVWLFVSACLLLVLIPNAVLFARLLIARKQSDCRPLEVGAAEDHRDHVLVYLLALLLPFYSEDLDTWRAFSATLAAVVMVIFLFWHLNLHYMNILFAALGLHVFSISPPANASSLSGRDKLVLITRRRFLPEGTRATAYRLSNTVYWEKTT